MRKNIIVTFFVYLIFLSVSFPALAQPNRDEAVALRYQVYKGGFHALTLQAELSRDAKVYEVTFSAETEGLIGLIYPYLLRGTSHGALEAGALLPKGYEIYSETRTKKRSRRLTYRDDGTVAAETTPARDLRKLNMEEASGRLDPVSAMLAIVQRLSETGKCVGRVEVSDGKRRYDLIPKDLGKTPVPKGYGIFKGEGHLCRITMETHSGFETKKQMDRVPPKIDVWLAPVTPGGQPVPVRLVSSSTFGAVIAHLVDIRDKTKLLAAEPPKAIAN
jgi:hypothetical protein